MKLSGIARRATVDRVAISGAGLGAEEIATNGYSAPVGPAKVNPQVSGEGLRMKPSGGSGLAVVIIVALLVWLSGFYVGRRIANEREVTKVESEVRTVTVPEESIIHEMPDPAAVRVVCTEAGNARILRADRRRLNDACTTLLLPQALRTNR